MYFFFFIHHWSLPEWRLLILKAPEMWNLNLFSAISVDQNMAYFTQYLFVWCIFVCIISLQGEFTADKMWIFFF